MTVHCAVETRGACVLSSSTTPLQLARFLLQRSLSLSFSLSDPLSLRCDSDTIIFGLTIDGP